MAKKPHNFDSMLEKTAVAAQELVGQNDRGTALVAAASLDDILAHLLEMNFVSGSGVPEKLLDGDGPLGTFSARINLAFCLGVISEEERYDLDQVRHIRNKFAHFAGPIDFQTQAIRDRCGSMKLAKILRNILQSPEYTHSLRTDPKSLFICAYTLLLMTLSLRAGQAENNRPVHEAGEIPDVRTMVDMIAFVSNFLYSGTKEEDDDEGQPATA